MKQIITPLVIGLGFSLGATAVNAQTATLGGGLAPLGSGLSGPGGGIAPTVPIGSTVGSPEGVANAGSVSAKGAWKMEIKPFLEQRLTYSDNINLAPDGAEEDDFVSTTSAGFTASANTRRIQGAAGYTLSYDSYLQSNNDDQFRHNAYANGTVEVINNLFYVDGRASISDTVLNGSGRYSGNATAAPDDNDLVIEGAISPYLRRNLGGWANAEVRYTFQGAIYEDGNGPLEQNPDEHTHTFSGALASDPRSFGAFGWDIRGEYEDYNNEDSTRDQDRLSGSVGLQYALTPKFTVNSNAGYDQYDPDISFDGNDASGAFGNLGFVYRPNQRLQTNAYAGYRYGGFDYGAGLNYELTERLSFNANAGRSIQSSSSQDSITVLQDANGNFVDPNGQPVNLQDLQAARRNNTSLTDTISMGLNGDTGKTTYSLTGLAQNRQYEDGIAGDEFVLSATGAVEYNVTRGLYLGADASYSSFDTDDLTSSSSDTLVLGLGARYKFTKIFEVFTRYSFSQRYSDAAVDEYTENAGMIGLRASF